MQTEESDTGKLRPFWRRPSPFLPPVVSWECRCRSGRFLPLLVATRARNHFIIFLLSGSGRRRLSFLPPTRRNAADPIGAVAPGACKPKLRLSIRRPFLSVDAAAAHVTRCVAMTQQVRVSNYCHLIRRPPWRRCGGRQDAPSAPAVTAAHQQTNSLFQLVDCY